MAMNLPYWTAAFLGLIIVSPSIYATDNYKEFKRDQLELEAGAKYFYSEANFSSSGDNQTLPSGNHFQILDTPLSMRYVPRRNWSIFGSTNIGSAQSKNSLATRTNSTFNDVRAGFDFLVYSDFFDLIPEVVGLMPLTTISPTSDVVANSEGVIEVHSRLIAQKDFGKFRGYAWLGLNYRAEGRSFLLPWGVGAQLEMNRIRWGAELYGYQSVTDDTNNKDGIIRTAYTNSVNAGSLKFYSRDPSLIEAQGTVTWLISKKWTVQGSAGMSLAGANTASGFHVGGFLRYSWDFTEGYVVPEYAPIDSPVPAYKAKTSLDDDLSSAKKVPRFKEAIDDGVDQTIFKAKPTKKPRVNRQQIQQQLDDTEFQIELKSKRKKKNN